MPIITDSPDEEDHGGRVPSWVESLDKIKKLASRSPQDAAAELSELAYQLNNNARPLPEIVAYKDIPEEERIAPPELIHGCLYQGGKMLIAAASKARKTWILFDLAISIANGMDWLGFKTTRTNVLLIDLELMKGEVLRRLDQITLKRGIIDRSGIDPWCLRGHSLTLERLKPKIVAHCKQNNVGFIAIDPYYRLSEGCDENSNGEIAKFLALLEEIAHETGAAVALSHHFAKGNAGVKNSIDRMSGAGTFARDPDALLALTEQESSTIENPIFVAEFTLRSFKPLRSFAIRWNHPIWQRDDSLGTSLKGATGRPRSGTVDDLLSLFSPNGEMQTKDLEKMAKQEGISRAVFYLLLKEAGDQGRIVSRSDGRYKFYKLNQFRENQPQTNNIKTDTVAQQQGLL